MAGWHVWLEQEQSHPQASHTVALLYSSLQGVLELALQQAACCSSCRLAMQEDPYSGLVGDSWRLPDEKAQFRLELERMVSVSHVLLCVTGPEYDRSILPVPVAHLSHPTCLQIRMSCDVLCNWFLKGSPMSSHLHVQGHIHFPSIIIWTLFNEVHTQIALMMIALYCRPACVCLNPIYLSQLQAALYPVGLGPV